MAQYTINHSCGHTGHVTLFGPTKDRYRRIEWLETRECDECYKEGIAAEKAAESARAAERQTALGLPELSGSDKQVAWALVLRQRVLERLAGMCSDDTARKQFTTIIAVETSAKWWIDHRDHSAVEIARTLMTIYPETVPPES